MMLMISDDVIPLFIHLDKMGAGEKVSQNQGDDD